MLNTPPTYAIYIAGLVFQLDQGARRRWRRWRSTTASRPRVLYDYLDQQRLLPQPGGARRPLADERAVHSSRTRRSTTPS